MDDSVTNLAAATASPGMGTARALYVKAFAEFGAQALWNMRQFERPTVGQILAITRALRTEGNLKARTLAEDIERALHADH